MNNIEKLELVTSVELSNAGTIQEPVFHFIYGSQLYGTLFTIYARFEGKEIDNGGGFRASKISMKLINYKGPLNIGFTDEDLEWREDGGIPYIDFHVMGESTTYVKDFFPEPFIVRKGTRSLIIFNRILDPMPKFRKYFDSRLNSDGTLDNSSSLLNSEPPSCQFFDSEFNERDGMDLYNRDLKPGMLGYDEVGLVGNRCNTSNVNLYF
jgi:hypothetical protein